METQQRELEARLSREGWLVVGREREPDWWVDELWAIESAWRPVGLRLWISFLVDPQYSGLRRKGENVWAIGVTSGRPTSRGDIRSDTTFSIRGHWSESLDLLTKEAQTMRDHAMKSGETG